MHRTLTLAGSLVLAASGFSQHTLQAERVSGRLRDAGVYHLGSRTWTHGEDTLATSKVLYRNDVLTGYCGVMGVPADLIWTDEGCLPGPAHEANAKPGPYVIQRITLRYCTTVYGSQIGGLQYYDSYKACTDPASLPVAGGFGFSVPGGGSSGFACWIVTFDLTGSTFDFPLKEDADGAFDGTTALDNFGWTLFLADGGSGGFNGPLLGADPLVDPYGDGTYYQNSAATDGSGLDTRDQHWLSDPSFTLPNGCYWFGGYAHGGPPFASFYTVLRGKNAGGDVGTKYCAANANSAGAPADLSAAGSASSGAGDLALTSAPVPNQNSIFFHAANQAQIPFGCSFLCATGNITRSAITPGVGNAATYTYDNSDTKHSLGGFVGVTRNFQHWFRDPMGAGTCGGQTFNTSNAISIAVLP
jgi:hypothetical protein